MNVLVINGPNLNMLGRRQPEVYGSDTLADLEGRIRAWAGAMAVETDFLQTNSEAKMIEAIHDHSGDGIVLNPGAFTHTSRAIADAIAAIEAPVVEVHMSNVHDREPWRAHSMVSDVCVHTIYGRGAVGYRDAVRHLKNRAAIPWQVERYGPHPDNIGDLRMSGEDLVVIVHGGIWRGEYERDTTESLAVDLAQRGVSTWNVEYRRLGRGGGWPASGQDVLTALDTVPRLGLAGRVSIVSHSAGSYLAMWAAARTRIEVNSHLALAPVLDLDLSVASGDQCASESADLINQGAPTFPGAGDIETIIVHGQSDQVVPVSHSQMVAPNHGLELHLTGTDHFSLLDPTKEEWLWTIERLGVET